METISINPLSPPAATAAFRAPPSLRIRGALLFLGSMVFHLCSLGGRVVLSPEPMGAALDTIQAEPEVFDGEIYRSAWRVARDQVPEDKFWHCRGWGWFEVWAGPCGYVSSQV